MKVMTLDLSTKQSGWCVGAGAAISSHGCITASHKDVVKRIIKMRDQIVLLIKNNDIETIVMEQVRPDFNLHTGKVLMWLQAVIVVAAYEINPKIKIEFINPSEWRATLKIRQGRGIRRDQLKPQDIQYVKNKYGIIVNDDEADAICIFDAYHLKNDNEINWQ